MWSEMARKLVRSLFWLYDPPPFLVRGEGGSKIFSRISFSSGNDLKWRETCSDHFSDTMTNPPSHPHHPRHPCHYVKGAREGGRREIFLPKKNSSRNGLKWRENWSNHFLSRIKVQSRGPFWDNLFLFFLLFNLRWAQLYVSLVVQVSHIKYGFQALV